MLMRERGRERAREARSLDQIPEPRVAPVEPVGDQEPRAECLSRCLAQLSHGNRDLILRYYHGEKSEKIKTRKELTQSLGVPASTLRMRALRVRETLQLCAEKCLQQQAAGLL